MATGALAILLTGCFMTPGKFTSEMRINDDGRFAYFYDGEITIIGLTKMAEMAAKADEEEFSAEPCTTDDGSERECTAAELEQQREAWDAAAPQRATERSQQGQVMRMMVGEVDLSDPEKIAEFSRKLERQAGWNTVRYRADGIFDVSFAIDGMLTHDFLFPVIEGFPMPGAFVRAHLRDEGIVRVEAPGFSAGAGGPGAELGGFTQLMGMAARSEQASEGEPDLPKIPPIEGTFRIVTNAQILANNTDEGPTATPTGNVLAWSIDTQTRTAPMAMLQLSR